MSDNPYDAILPPTRLDKAVDAAIADANAAFEADPEAQAAARDAGDLHRRWAEAVEILGGTAIVLPIAVAVEVLAALRGDPTHLPVEAMVADHIRRAQTQKD